MRIFSQDLGIVIWQRKIRHANNKKRETTRDERNGTTKSRKNKKALRKENIQILGNIRSRRHQIRGDERKNKKKSISGERESYTKPTYIEGNL